jgi:hypothetical protein
MTPMSHRKKRPLPPLNRIPENTGGTLYFDIAEYGVHNWHPLPDGKGAPTQVHVRFVFANGMPPMVLRLKGPAAVDELVDALNRHRFDVWPGERPPDE